MEFSMALLSIMHKWNHIHSNEIYHICKLAICIKYEDAQNKPQNYHWMKLVMNLMDEIKLQNHIDRKLTRLWNLWHYIIIPHRWIHVHKFYHKDEMNFKCKNHNIYEVVNMDVEILCLIWNSIIVLEFHNMDENLHLKNNNLYISLRFINLPTPLAPVVPLSFYIKREPACTFFLYTHIFHCLQTEISFNLFICYYCKHCVINNMAQKQKWKLENCSQCYPQTFFKYKFNFIFIRMLVIFVVVVQKKCLESILESQWTFRFMV